MKIELIYSDKDGSIMEFRGGGFRVCISGDECTGEQLWEVVNFELNKKRIELDELLRIL